MSVPFTRCIPLAPNMFPMLYTYLYLQPVSLPLAVIWPWQQFDGYWHLATIYVLLPIWEISTDMAYPAPHPLSLVPHPLPPALSSSSSSSPSPTTAPSPLTPPTHSPGTESLPSLRMNSSKPREPDTLLTMAADAIKTAAPVRMEFIAIMVVVVGFAIIYSIHKFTFVASNSAVIDSRISCCLSSLVRDYMVKASDRAWEREQKQKEDERKKKDRQWAWKLKKAKIKVKIEREDARRKEEDARRKEEAVGKGDEDGGCRGGEKEGGEEGEKAGREGNDAVSPHIHLVMGGWM
ncbi:hypothetical protein L211DRAFT_864617 [Terfezia boudieri ATCC MYA-4762]|uniref:Uncharacterized protein n=1 Tax=Terfezia boudieri ATCC MYA-4762 TaxID=1051890 RepID=A0A3N4M1T2_9PEZI|nr:hypothetical protein L211DRAFT_864617 [Terfezia boudieri ATCC MYA-4762]